MPTPRRTLLLSRLAACVLLASAGSLPAMAQPAELPAQVVNKGKLSDDDVRQIAAFIDRYKIQLANDKDPNGVKVARMRLTEPLTDAQASVDFRQRYSEALVPVLDPLVQSTSEFVASNATQILGKLATHRAVERIAPVLDDKRSAVRYSASYAVQLAFENLMPPRTPGLTSEQARSVIDSVVKRMGVEEDANVVQGFVMALEAASEVPGAQLKDVRAHAVSSAAKGVAARAQAMDGKQEIDARWLQVIWRANRLTRAALTQAPVNEPRLTDAALKESGRLAGQTLALALRRVKAGIKSPSEREILTQAVALAEATYFFADSNLGGTPPSEAQLSKLLNDPAKFEAGVMAIIGPNGPLTSPRFGFGANEFVK